MTKKARYELRKVQCGCCSGRGKTPKGTECACCKGRGYLYEGYTVDEQEE